MGPEHCYIKVSCYDRRGLLADILHALRGLPLEITRAAITTTPDGTVTDIFEMRQLNESGREMTSDEIKHAVEMQLAEAEETRNGRWEGKRRKVPAGSALQGVAE